MRRRKIQRKFSNFEKVHFANDFFCRHGQFNRSVKKAVEADLEIEEKILRRREMAHLFQWYYPEGGWGWIVLLCAFLSQTLAHGIQFGFSYPLGVSIRKRFYLTTSENGYSNQTIDQEEVIRQPIVAQHIGK